MTRVHSSFLNFFIQDNSHESGWRYGTGTRRRTWWWAWWMSHHPHLTPLWHPLKHSSWTSIQRRRPLENVWLVENMIICRYGKLKLYQGVVECVIHVEEEEGPIVIGKSAAHAPRAKKQQPGWFLSEYCACSNPQRIHSLCVISNSAMPQGGLSLDIGNLDGPPSTSR